MKTSKLLSTLAATAGLVVSSGTASAAATIYEPFNYAAGAINGTQSGATGTTGGWTNSGNVSGNNFSVVSPGLTFTGLDTTGGAVRRPSAPGGAEISVGVSTDAQTALLANDSSIYFSLLYRSDRNSVGNDNLTFMIGSGAFTNNDNDGDIPTIAGGEGFGILTTARNSNPSSIMNVYGYTADNNGVSTTASVSGTSFHTGTTAVGTYMILGRIDWVANGGNDTLTLWNITDPAAGLPGSSFATMTADLDQSAFDTLAITDRQVGTFDEIRFGTSLGDVGVIPEPSTALLGAFGLLALLRRRRA